jgi:hypothetical protein
VGGEACSALATEWRPWQALGPSRGDRSRRAYRPSETFVAPPLRTAAIDPLLHFKICPANAPEVRERGLWLNGGLGQPTVPERIRSSQSARSHSVRVPSAAARSAAPNVRRQLQRPLPPPSHLRISVIPCAARRRHRGRPRQTATGFRTASRRNQRPSAVALAGPADSRGTADGQSPAQPTTRRGGAPCRNVRSRSRNCNRPRNPYNPVGGAATVGVWRRATAAAARRREWSLQRLGRHASWEHDRRGEGVQCAASKPWPKK